jgi:hypothetical protein
MKQETTIIKRDVSADGKGDGIYIACWAESTLWVEFTLGFFSRFQLLIIKFVRSITVHFP